MSRRKFVEIPIVLTNFICNSIITHHHVSYTIDQSKCTQVFMFIYKRNQQTNYK